MSGQALVWASEVRGLKAATKIVLIQLSGRHNKDTSLCNPSIATLAEDCEMDRTTVMRHLEVLERAGLVTRVARGNADGGRASNEYILHMPKPVITDVSERVKSQITTGVKSQSDGGLSRKNGGVKSHSYATRTLLEPDSEPRLFGSDEPQVQGPKPDDRFEEFWAAYPAGGRKSKKTAAAKFAAAVKRGAGPEQIIGAAKVYAQTDQVLRGFAKHASTWLNGECWNDEDLQPVRAVPPLPQDGSIPEDAMAAAVERHRREREKRAEMQNFIRQMHSLDGVPHL